MGVAENPPPLYGGSRKIRPPFFKRIGSAKTAPKKEGAQF